ncbi:MAG: hypothetical protein LBB38_01125 [Puniceicoccales bacterium]|jgi:hypothetical protein|nr:hypothetical protein [Puniceicoccales bacterium]
MEFSAFIQSIKGLNLVIDSLRDEDFHAGFLTVLSAPLAEQWQMLIGNPIAMENAHRHIADAILTCGNESAIGSLMSIYLSGAESSANLIQDFLRATIANCNSPTDVDVEKIIRIGEIDWRAIQRNLLRLAISRNFATDANKILRFETLWALHENAGLQHSLLAITAGGPVDTLTPFKNRPTTSLQLARDALLAACTPIRQKEGASICFATAIAIAAQWNFPGATFELLAKLLQRRYMPSRIPGSDFGCVRVPLNTFEGLPSEPEANAVVALQLMLVRTLADASKVSAFHSYDTSAFRRSLNEEHVKQFQSLVKTLNVTLDGAAHPELKIICGKYPRYDFSRENGRIGRHGNRSVGVWFLPVGLSQDRLITPWLFFQEYIPSFRAAASTNPLLQDATAMVDNLASFHIEDLSFGGGAPLDVLNVAPAQYTDCHRISLDRGDAVACLRGALNALLLNLVGKNHRRIIVCGDGHTYTLGADLCPHIASELLAILTQEEICDRFRKAVLTISNYKNLSAICYICSDEEYNGHCAFTESVLDGLLGRVLDNVKNSGAPALFFDPNWRDSAGVGIRYNPITQSYELCNAPSDGSAAKIENEPCFFGDLAFKF